MPTQFDSPEKAAKAVCHAARGEMPMSFADAIREKKPILGGTMSILEGTRQEVEPRVAKALSITMGASARKALFVERAGDFDPSRWGGCSVFYEDTTGASVARCHHQTPDGKEEYLDLYVWKRKDGKIQVAMMSSLYNAVLGRKSGCAAAILAVIPIGALGAWMWKTFVQTF